MWWSTLFFLCQFWVIFPTFSFFLFQLVAKAKVTFITHFFSLLQIESAQIWSSNLGEVAIREKIEWSYYQAWARSLIANKSHEIVVLWSKMEILLLNTYPHFYFCKWQEWIFHFGFDLNDVKCLIVSDTKKKKEEKKRGREPTTCPSRLKALKIYHQHSAEYKSNLEYEQPSTKLVFNLCIN